MIKGVIRCRQRVLDFETVVGDDGETVPLERGPQGVGEGLEVLVVQFHRHGFDGGLDGGGHGGLAGGRLGNIDALSIRPVAS